MSAGGRRPSAAQPVTGRRMALLLLPLAVVALVVVAIAALGGSDEPPDEASSTPGTPVIAAQRCSVPLGVDAADAIRARFDPVGQALIQAGQQRLEWIEGRLPGADYARTAAQGIVAIRTARSTLADLDTWSPPCRDIYDASLDLHELAFELDAIAASSAQLPVDVQDDAARLRVLGDRVFDQAQALIGARIDSDLTIHPIPDWVALGLRDQTTAPTPTGTGPDEDLSWAQRLDGLGVPSQLELEAAIAAGSPETDLTLDRVRRLELDAALVLPDPDDDLRAALVRLALLVADEALDNLAPGVTPVDSTDRLLAVYSSLLEAAATLDER